MVEVRQSNPKAFEELDLRLKQLQGFEGRAGWFPDAVYPDGTPVAYVAAIQELGSESRSIPARPFMRPAAIKNEDKWRATAALAATRILDGKMTGEQGMELIASVAAEDIVDSIKDVNSPPLSQITLGVRKYRQEGKKVTGATIGEIARLLDEGKLDVSGVSTKPLNDTGFLLSKLTHAVVPV